MSAPATPGDLARSVVPRIPRVRAGGIPDDPAWSSSPVLELRRAQDGGAVVQSTRVRALHDGRTLFVRFDCDDRDIWATHARRDAPLWEEEVVEVFLAPGPDTPSDYVEIEVNPLGAVFDARVANPDGSRGTMRVDTSWDAGGLVTRVTRPSAPAWRVELALPWIALCEGEPPAEWRANFFRIDRPPGGAHEYSCWSPTYTDPPDFHRPALFGHLVLG